MISFFRLYDPIRLLAVLVLIAAIRLPHILLGLPISVAQMDYMLVGERLAQGFSMYSATFDTLEPLSAAFYWLAYLLFGKSFVFLQVFGMLLVYFQAIYITIVFNIDNVFDERSTLPGVVYVIFASLFFDMLYVSPILLGISFLIPVFHWLFQNLKIDSKEENVYFSGIFVGLASLFQLHLAFFIILVLVYLVLFIKPSTRIYLTVIIGFVIPWLCVGLYYYLMEGSNPLIQYLYLIKISDPLEKLVSNKSILLLVCPMILVFVLGVVYTFNYSRYVNYQYNIIKIMGLYTIIAILILLFMKSRQPCYLVVLMPSLVFFSTQYFHHIRSFWFGELPFAICSLACIFISYGTLSPSVNKLLKINLGNIVLVPDASYQDLTHKRILVLGDSRGPFLYGSPGSPYINWRFAKSIFTNKSDYEKTSEIYQWLKAEKPEVIIDENNIVPFLFASIPALKKQYTKRGFEDVYELVR